MSVVLILKNRLHGCTDRISLDNEHLSIEENGEEIADLSGYLDKQEKFSAPSVRDLNKLMFSNKGMTGIVEHYAGSMNVGDIKSTVDGKKSFQPFRMTLGKYSKKTGKLFETRSDDNDVLYIKRIK